MSKNANILIGFLSLLLLFTPAFALTVDAPLPDQAQETRAKNLFHDIRCVVCQSESIADSPAEVARDMRRTIREEITDGKSDTDIKNTLATKYGDGILMNPPLKPLTALLWFGPWLVLGLGGLLAYFFFRKKS